MCNGSIMDKLISFSLPLMLSGILQLMFNAVDIVVVGRFSGSEALAAVGSTTALINMFTNLFIGVSLGTSVLTARFYAAGRDREVSETVHTSITLALLSGILMIFVGLFFSRGALELMDTPDDVIDLSTLYMKIYFMGMPFFMLYNYGAAVLRAVGDTKRPLLFLDHLRYSQCRTEPVSCGSLSHGSGWCRDRHSGLSDAFLCPGADLSLSGGEQLSAQIFQTDAEVDLSETDFSGGSTGRHPEYSHQFFQCTPPVFRKFVWFHCNGRLYGSQ